MSSTSRWKTKAAATIWARPTVCWWPSWRWPSTGRIARRCSPRCWNFWPTANCAPPREEPASEPAHRRDHFQRRAARPLARRPVPRFIARRIARRVPGARPPPPQQPHPVRKRRARSLDALCRDLSLEELLAECQALDRFRRTSDNLYERVRALFFLYAIHRFHIPLRPAAGAPAPIPFAGYCNLLKRRFEEAIDLFLAAQAERGSSAAISSALAAGYKSLAFQTLADQVRRSVRSVRGNQWMFRTGHPADYPLRLRAELLDGAPVFPILRETTPVRMDLTHSGWSDIFFLGMDFPEGARVLNISIDLAVRSAAAPDAVPKPPVEAYFRVIDQPVLRLTSVDLQATADVTSFAEVFDFARDYLGLLKAAAISSGLVPPGMEGATQPLSELLARLT